MQNSANCHHCDRRLLKVDMVPEGRKNLFLCKACYADAVARLVETATR
jgi:hypothetical protein